MTLFGPILASPDVLNGPISTTQLANLFGHTTAAGKHVTEESAMGMSAIWRAVNLIATTVASLPLHPYLSDAAVGGRVRATGRTVALLAEPNSEQTPLEYWETVMVHLLLWGNAYAKIERDGLGDFVGFKAIHPSRMQVGRIKVDGQSVKVYQVTSDGKRETYRDTLADGSHGDILHIPGLGYDGVVGVSPIRAAQQGIALSLAAEEFGAKFFSNGLLAGAVLQTEQTLTQEQAERIQKRAQQKWGGLTGSHKIIVLDKGAKVTPITIPPGDAQFIESRKFQIEEVARLYGTPPHMLMDTEKSTSWGTGIEQQNIGFVTYTLRGYLSRIEQRLNRLLKVRKEYVKFALEGLLRGDSAQRSAFYTAMLPTGAISPNQIAALEELPPVPGGDQYFRSANLVPLGDGATEDAEQARAAAELMQKAYLAIGKGLSADEFRTLADRVGAKLPEGWAPPVEPTTPQGDQ